MKYNRSYSFTANPVMLPEAVLEEIAAEVMNYRGRGLSVMELSANSAAARQLAEQAEAEFRKLLSIPADSTVLFADSSVAFAALPGTRDFSRELFYTPLPTDEAVYADLSCSVGIAGISVAILPEKKILTAAAPTCWATYCCGKVLRYFNHLGGLEILLEQSRENAAHLRDFLRKQSLFTLNEAVTSPQQVAFTAPDAEELVSAAAGAHLLLPLRDNSLEIHLCLSTPREAVDALTEFLRKYQTAHQ